MTSEESKLWLPTSKVCLVTGWPKSQDVGASQIWIWKLHRSTVYRLCKSGMQAKTILRHSLMQVLKQTKGRCHPRSKQISIVPPKRSINVLKEFKVFQSIVLNNNNSKTFSCSIFNKKIIAPKLNSVIYKQFHLKQEQLLGRFTQQE